MSYRELYYHDAVLELLAVFSQVAKSSGIDYFVVGAVARDLRLSDEPGYLPTRATKDVDIAIMVGSEIEFEKVKVALVATGVFTPDENQAIKLLYKNAIEVDLLPFGGIEGQEREVHIERPRPFIMDVPAFTEVLSEATVLTVNGVDLRVCSLEGIILLKLFSNADKPSRTKDISDIEQILKAYFDISMETIFTDFADVADFYATSDPDYLPLVSARTVGRVMYRILRNSQGLRQRLLEILREKTPNRYWPEMLAGLEDLNDLPH